ncbi:MAG: acyl-CoA reductase [Bacteroidales bacterium]|nr:acyl-CoA reductase [Bacteroidales bacterium]
MQASFDIPFSPDVLDYLSVLSAQLMRDSATRAFPDVGTFAFFCRKANLEKWKKAYGPLDGRVGRGVVFHIAPSNVPVNFAYSMAVGLLAGNANIVKVSSKDFPQVTLIRKHLEALQETHPVGKRVKIVHYPNTREQTDAYSSQADVRVIWGGDATIAAIRQSPLPPRSFDVCFADRYSIAAIDADAVFRATEQELSALAEGFYNDTYLFDQNACSAPHLVLWRGAEAGRTRFWKAVHQVATAKYPFQDVQAIDKLDALFSQAVAIGSRQIPTQDNLLVRASLDTLPQDIDAYRCTGGYFLEHTLVSLSELSAIVNRKYQTLAYYGFSPTELQDAVCGLPGIDRIVPIGKTTEFSLFWDGFDLIRTLSRVVTIA